MPEGMPCYESDLRSGLLDLGVHFASPGHNLQPNPRPILR